MVFLFGIIEPDAKEATKTSINHQKVEFFSDFDVINKKVYIKKNILKQRKRLMVLGRVQAGFGSVFSDVGS